MLQQSAVIWALSACLIFLVLAVPFVPLAGPQNDEVLFAMPLAEPSTTHHSISVFQHRIPLMVMGYVGCLKTWIYIPLWNYLTPSPWVLRLPPILAGAISVIVFFLLLRRLAGLRIAAAGAFLFATDPMFVLTNTFDWGPVAIQHLCFLAALLSFVVWRQSEYARGLGSGCLFLGLGLWDKALFLWLLGGLGASAVLLFRKELREALRPRRLRTAFLFFVLGALPWLLFNVRRPGGTFQGTARLAADKLDGKLLQLKLNLQGEGLYAYLANEDWVEPSRPVTIWLGQVANLAHRVAGEPRTTWLLWAVVAALLSAPAWWRSRLRRQILFVLITGATAWLAMALTRDAGGAAHHVVLLWPLPHWLVAAVFGTLTEQRKGGRLVFVLLIALLASRQFLVTAEYARKLERNGAGDLWTTALWTLGDRMQAYQERPVYLADWGMQNSLEFLSRGRLQTGAASDPFLDDDLTAGERDIATRMLATPGAIFVGYVEGKEVFTGVRSRLEQFAAAQGYRKLVRERIADGHKRPIFEVFEFVPTDTPAAP